VDADPGSGLKPAVAAEPPVVPAASAAPPPQPQKQLAGRLIGLGAIPIAVFCATFILARAFLGMQTPTQQGWVFTMALIGSLASLFVLASLAARTVVGEVDAVREAVRNVADGTPQQPMPELTPPLEDLKQEVIHLAREKRPRLLACLPLGNVAKDDRADLLSADRDLRYRCLDREFLARFSSRHRDAGIVHAPVDVTA